MALYKGDDARIRFNGKLIAPVHTSIHTINCRCVMVFDIGKEPEQLELKLVQIGSWDEIKKSINWQPNIME